MQIFFSGNVLIPGSRKMAMWRLAFEQRSSANRDAGLAPDSNVPGKSTMNGFAIDSLEELREYMLG